MPLLYPLISRARSLLLYAAALTWRTCARPGHAERRGCLYTSSRFLPFLPSGSEPCNASSCTCTIQRRRQQPARYLSPHRRFCLNFSNDLALSLPFSKLYTHATFLYIYASTVRNFASRAHQLLYILYSLSHVFSSLFYPLP